MNIPCSCTCTLLKSQSHELECYWFTQILISVCSFVWRNNERHAAVDAGVSTVRAHTHTKRS
jgi:hypothetical protein